MELIIDHVNSITIVTFPEASLDVTNNRDFMKAMSPVLKSETQVIFDMSKISFVDSHGLASIMVCRKRLKPSGGFFKLCGLSKSIQGLFDIVRLQKIFDIYKTREEAIQAFQS